MSSCSRHLYFPVAALALGVGACDYNPAANTPTPPTAVLEKPGVGPMSVQADPGAALVSMMDNANLALAAKGANYRAAIAEYVTDGSGGEAGGTVLAKDVGNKQLGHDFIPLDPRRAGSPITNGGWSGSLAGPDDDITYAIDATGDAVPLAGGLTGAQTRAAIIRGHNTWEALLCSSLPQTANPDFGQDIGLLAFILSGGAIGSPFVFGDVQHAGWRDLNFAGGVLGVTITFIFVDDSGDPTDIDGDRRLDTAFREIYYDPIDNRGTPTPWNWADNGVSNIDVETVALHEIGHGLSQAHFGKVWLKNDGSLEASPRAVMNALYAGPFRVLVGTDNGGHCTNWGSWPNN